MEVSVSNSRDFSFSPGLAYWSRRGDLKKNEHRIRSLAQAVKSEGELALYQWCQLLAITLEYAPDTIIELGRKRGNSTCVFTEAINLMGSTDKRIVSVCLSPDWELETSACVAKLVGQEWFKPLRIVTHNILEFDFENELKSSSKALIFWDAHGFDIAECVLGKILPLLVHKEHLVIMHDLSDSKYDDSSLRFYGDKQLWKGGNSGDTRVRIGNINSAVEQSVAIVDFTSRNDIKLHSGEDSLLEHIGGYPERINEMRSLLGDEMFSQRAHWFYFSINESPYSVITFPRFVQHRSQALIESFFVKLTKKFKKLMSVFTNTR